MSSLRFAAGVCVLAAGPADGCRGRGRRCRSTGCRRLPLRTAMTAPTLPGQQTSTKKPKMPKNEPGGAATRGGTLGGQSGPQPSTEEPKTKTKNEPGGAAPQDETKDSGRPFHHFLGYRWGGAGYRWGGAGSRWGGAGYRWGGAGYRWGGAGYRLGWRRLPMGWRRLPMGWRRLPMGWRRLPMGWRRLPMGWRRLPMGWRQWRQFLTSSR